MKTKILYSAAFTFILSLLLTSCAFLHKEEFASRKYYNFPLTKHSSEGVKTEQALMPVQKTVTEKISANKETSDEITTASVDKKQVAAVYKEIKPFYSETHTAKPVEEDKIENASPVVSLKKAEILKIARNKMANSASGSDSMLILELILAILLPPLAVLLHNGYVHKWFWITLLLCIVGGVLYGMSYVGGGFFFYGLAALLALMYVFGTIKD